MVDGATDLQPYNHGRTRQDNVPRHLCLELVQTSMYRQTNLPDHPAKEGDSPDAIEARGADDLIKNLVSQVLPHCMRPETHPEYGHTLYSMEFLEQVMNRK